MFRKIIKSFLARFGISDTMFLQYRNRDAFKVQKEFFKKNRNPVIFDVGAFDGRTMKKYRTIFKDAIIHSFEPSPDSYSLLVKAGRRAPNFIPNQLALSNTIGKAEFSINRYQATNSLLPSRTTNTVIDNATRPKEKIDVNVETIDSYCSRNSIETIDILKIDVQGGELKVLEGAKNILSKGNVKMIFTELEIVELYERQPLMQDIVSHLSTLGYVLFSFYNLSYMRNGQLTYCDAVFIRKADSLF